MDSSTLFKSLKSTLTELKTDWARTIRQNSDIREPLTIGYLRAIRKCTTDLDGVFDHISRLESLDQSQAAQKQALEAERLADEEMKNRTWEREARVGSGQWARLHTEYAIQENETGIIYPIGRHNVTPDYIDNYTTLVRTVSEWNQV